MSDKRVRVRFAPSPTGGLHLGGVRTALFNYLFAKKHNGDFVLRIEDTDQNRFVEGAEQYIIDCLNWCGIIPDESVLNPGQYAPYRQSERKSIYREYAERLVMQGHAYYAFDTAEELDKNRKEIPNFQYGQVYRDGLRNSLSLPQHEVDQLLDNHTPHVIRIKIPADQSVSFTDMIRGRVTFETNQVDDKVLLKADGMPTYHLAVVVDDYLMKISHAFRGEEWLPSAPVHLLLWDYLGWKADMPQWAHLPLILKPDGNGKLSKRDGTRLGFPVFALDWDGAAGFDGMGFLPEAFINFLATLGWNDGSGQEIFTLDELVSKFSIDRISKAGAKFDFEKAKWFNSEWIKKKHADELKPMVKKVLEKKGIVLEQDDQKLLTVIGLVQDRCILISDFYQQASYFFQPPVEYDFSSIKSKWTSEKDAFFKEYLQKIDNEKLFWPIKDEEEFRELALEHALKAEETFKELAEQHSLKTGDVMLPLRIMLVGGKFGPNIFEIAALIGKDETISRINKALIALKA